MVSSQTILINIHPWNTVFPSLYNVHIAHIVQFLHYLYISPLSVLNKKSINILIRYYLFLIPKIISLSLQIHSYTVLYYLLFEVLYHTLRYIRSLVQNHALSYALSFLYFLSSSVLLFILIHSKISTVSFCTSSLLVQTLFFHLCNCWIVPSYDALVYRTAFLLYFLLYMLRLSSILLLKVSVCLLLYSSVITFIIDPALLLSYFC